MIFCLCVTLYLDIFALVFLFSALVIKARFLFLITASHVLAAFGSTPSLVSVKHFVQVGLGFYGSQLQDQTASAWFSSDRDK